MLLTETCYYLENQVFGVVNNRDMSLIELCFCLRLLGMQKGWVVLSNGEDKMANSSQLIHLLILAYSVFPGRFPHTEEYIHGTCLGSLTHMVNIAVVCEKFFQCWSILPALRFVADATNNGIKVFLEFNFNHKGVYNGIKAFWKVQLNHIEYFLNFSVLKKINKNWNAYQI